MDEFLLHEVDLVADLVSTIDSNSPGLYITSTISEHDGHLAYLDPSKSSSCRYFRYNH